MNKILSTLIVTAFATMGAHAADKVAPLTTPAVVAAPASAVAAVASASAVAPAASADHHKAKAQKLKDMPVKAEVMPPQVPATK